MLLFPKVRPTSDFRFASRETQPVSSTTVFLLHRRVFYDTILQSVLVCIAMMLE